MSIKERISTEIKEAMKSRDQLRLDTLRMVVSAIKNREIEKKDSLDDKEVVSILGTLIKQRRESVELYGKGGRTDLAEKEEQEIAMLKDYMPEELSETELAEIIKTAIAESGATSMADMGKVMKAVVPKTTGKAEGKVVNEMVKKLLAG